MLLDNLLEIQQELNKHHHTKHELNLQFFDKRLQTSLNAYNRELDRVIDSLHKESVKTILRGLHYEDKGN